MHLTLWLYPLHLGSYSYQGGILPFLNYHLLNFERTEKEIPKIKEWATTSSLESLEQEKKNTIVDGLVRHWHQSFYWPDSEILLPQMNLKIVQYANTVFSPS